MAQKPSSPIMLSPSWGFVKTSYELISIETPTPSSQQVLVEERSSCGDTGDSKRRKLQNTSARAQVQG